MNIKTYLSCQHLPLDPKTHGNLKDFTPPIYGLVITPKINGRFWVPMVGISTRHRFRPCPTSQGTEKDEANCKSPKAFQRTSPPMEAKPKSCPRQEIETKTHTHTHPIRIRVCLYVLRFFGVISGLYIYNPMTWGWDLDHPSYEFSGRVLDSPQGPKGDL